MVHDGLAISLGELKKRALRTAARTKIAYLVDLIYSERNIEEIVALAGDADQLFIETPFLDEDAQIAAERRRHCQTSRGPSPYSFSLLGSLPRPRGPRDACVATLRPLRATGMILSFSQGVKADRCLLLTQSRHSDCRNECPIECKADIANCSRHVRL